MSDSPSGIPQVQDHRPRIAGVLPKNAQTRVLAGVSLLMILVMMFSGHKAAPTKAASSGASLAQAVIDPSAARIQEYRTRIEDQTRQLALEEAQLAQTKQAFGVGPVTAAPGPGPVTRSAGAPMAPEYTPQPERSWIELDREKREYQGLYASNIALSYRRAETTPGPEAGAADSGATGAGVHVPPAKNRAGATVADGIAQHRLFEGTIIETVLTNRLDSTFSGPVNCMVTTDVYARDHQTLLIPRGTRTLGEVRKLGSFGEQRLAVTFHRLIMPDGSSVSLDQFKGLDQIGQTGLLDQVNHHYLQVFGVSLAIGAIAGLSQVNTRYSLDESGAQAYEQGVAGSLSQSSLHILDRYLNVLPTFTIREGHRIKIYLSQDLLLPAYGEHPASDL